MLDSKVCEICGRPAKTYLFGSFLCEDNECMEKARMLRGGPAGHKLRVVSIGSKNPVKIKAVEEAMLKTIGNVLVVGVDVESGVSEQPIGFKETCRGAINRAKNAMEKNPALYSIGIEAGLVELCSDTEVGSLQEGKYMDIHVCVVYDGLNFTVGTSQGFQLPKELVKEMKKGIECSSVAEKIYGIEDIGQKNGVIGYLTDDNIKRIDLCRDAVIMAMIPRMTRNVKLDF